MLFVPAYFFRTLATITSKSMNIAMKEVKSSTSVPLRVGVFCPSTNKASNFLPCSSFVRLRNAQRVQTAIK